MTRVRAADKGTTSDDRSGDEDGGRGEAAGRQAPRDLERRRLVESIAVRLGSRREAMWIVDHGGIERADALADRRAAGEPLQYVLGRWQFRSLELQVDRRVLIPRPETEQVVDVALTELARSVEAEGPERRSTWMCADLGTGSGAIALSLAVEGGPLVPDLEVWATDASADALAVAGRNLGELALTDPAAADRVRMVGGDWFAALPGHVAGRLDLVVSNPPYVAESEYPSLDPVVRDWEPRSALVAGPGLGGVGGMAAIEAIVTGALQWLQPSGVMVVELAPSQAPAAVGAARRAGFGRVRTAQDLAGRVRMLVARR